MTEKPKRIPLEPLPPRRLYEPLAETPAHETLPKTKMRAVLDRAMDTVQFNDGRIGSKLGLLPLIKKPSTRSRRLCAPIGADETSSNSAALHPTGPIRKRKKPPGRPTKVGKPWEAAGISKAEWYRRRKAGKPCA